MKKRQVQSKYKIIPESTVTEDDYGGFFVTLDDLKIMYHALKEYRPSEDEEQLYELLLESFEEELWTETHLDEN